MLRPRRMRGRPWHEAVASEVRRLTSVASNTVSDKVPWYMVLSTYSCTSLTRLPPPPSGGASGSMAAGKRRAASGRGGGLLRRRSIGEEEGGGRAQARSCGGWCNWWRRGALHSADGRQRASTRARIINQRKKESRSCREAPTHSPTNQTNKKERMRRGAEGTARAHK